MARKRAEALLDLAGDLDRVRAVLRVEAQYPDPPKSKKDTLIAEGLRSAALVLLTGAFEKYLKAAFEEQVSALDGHLGAVRDERAKKYDALPDKLRVTNAFESLNLAMRGPRYGEPGGKVNRLKDVHAASRNLSRGALIAQAFSRTQGNPDAGVTTELFRNVGVTDPFAGMKNEFETKWGSPVAETWIQDNLNSMIRDRNLAAHSMLSVSRHDLSEFVRFVECLAHAVDSHLKARFDTLVALLP